MCVKSYPAWPFPHLQARSAEFGAPDQTVAAKSPASVCGLLSARAAPHAAPASAGPPAPTHTHTHAHTPSTTVSVTPSVLIVLTLAWTESP